MAKQKSFHSKLVAKLKRDAGCYWTGELVDAIGFALLSKKMSEPVPAAARGLLGRLFPCFQQESFVASACDMFLGAGVEAGDFDDYPPIYPAIMLGWEFYPKSMELEEPAAEFLKGTSMDFRDIPLEVLKKPFPACLLIDTRAFKFNLHNISVDGVFVYPSFDADRNYSMLHFLGISMKKGLDYALEAKLVLKGDTLGEAILASEEERCLLRKRILAGVDRGQHNCLFSPLDDEPEFMEFATRILAFSFSEYALVEERTVSEGTLLRVSLRSQEALSCKDGGALKAIAETEALQPAEGEENAEAAAVEGEEAFFVVDDAVVQDEAEEEPVANEEQVDSADIDTADVDAVTAQTSAPEDDPFSYEALFAMVEELQDENKALRDAVSAAENQNASLGYHLKQAQGSVDKLRVEAEALRGRAALVETMAIPETPIEALELAERAFSDKLIIVDEARKSARNFERGSASETWAVLQAMAVTLHRLVFQQTAGNLTHAFQAETGFAITLRDVKHTNRNAEYAKERRVFYGGEERDITAHVKGKSIKKAECLRVHFFADYSTNKIVIAHCGEHLTTFETSKL